MSEENLKKIVRIVQENLGVSSEEITPATHLVNDLGADSLDHVELVMTLEEEFEIEIPDEQAERLNTVQDIIDLINAQVPAVAVH